MHQPLPPTSEIDRDLAPIYRRIEQRLSRRNVLNRVGLASGLVLTLGIAGTSTAIAGGAHHTTSYTAAKSDLAPEFVRCLQRADIDASQLRGAALTKQLKESGYPADGTVTLVQIVYPDDYSLQHDLWQRITSDANRCQVAISNKYDTTLVPE